MKYRSILYTSLLITLFAWQTSVSSKIYKWVDADGKVHYSDKPHVGAEAVELKPINKIKSITRGQRRASKIYASQDKPDKEKSGGYQSITLISPSNEQAIRTNAAIVTLSAALVPPLLKGHKVEFRIDGQAVAPASQSLSAQSKPLKFGQHSATVVVKNRKGNVIKSSKASQFYVLNFINHNKKKK